MGCASSNGMVPGAVLEGKDGNIMDHAKRMLGQETTNKVSGEAMGKLHEFGGAVKEKVGTVVEDIEDRVKSMVSGTKSQVEQISTDVNGQMESITQGLDSMTDQVESMAQDVENTIKPEEEKKRERHVTVKVVELSSEPEDHMLVVEVFSSGGTRPNSAASTAEAAGDAFPPDSLDDIKRDMETNDLEVTELLDGDDTAPETEMEVEKVEPEVEMLDVEDEPAEESEPVEEIDSEKPPEVAKEETKEETKEEPKAEITVEQPAEPVQEQTIPL